MKQKAFRLKEDVLVFSDPSQSMRLYRIRADRIIDSGGRYDITGTALPPELARVVIPGLLMMTLLERGRG